jgi:Flp pilus assembly pilin Flp
MNRIVATARRLRSLLGACGRGAREFITGREEGASILEYVFPIAMIALICIAAMQFMGSGISNFLHKMGEKLNSLVP